MNIFQKTFTRFFEMASLIETDLSKGPFPEKEMKGFEFRKITDKDIPAVKEMCKARPDHYFKIYEAKLLDKENNLGFAFIEQSTGKLAYTRWVVLNHFYSDIIRSDINLRKDQALTCDSYCHPDYRNMGLHREANGRMLNLLIKDGYKGCFAVERFFQPHIKKVTRLYGFRRKNVRIFYIKGSFPDTFKKVVNKIIPSKNKA